MPAISSPCIILRVQHGKGLGEVYFLVTHPEFSGPPPTRSPPPIAIPLSPGKLTKNFSIRSNISHPASIGEDDEYDDADDDEELSTEIARRQLLNTTDLVLPLPPLVTGIHMFLCLSFRLCRNLKFSSVCPRLSFFFMMLGYEWAKFNKG